MTILNLREALQCVTCVAGRVRVTINHTHVRAGIGRALYPHVSGRAINHIHVRCGLRTILSFLVEWPPYEVGFKSRRRMSVARLSGAGEFFYWAPASSSVPVTRTSLRGDRGDDFD